MTKIGTYLAILGFGSILLKIIGYQFVILQWIDQGGTKNGWIIRFVILGFSAIFLFIGQIIDDRKTKRLK